MRWIVKNRRTLFKVSRLMRRVKRKRQPNDGVGVAGVAAAVAVDGGAT